MPPDNSLDKWLGDHREFCAHIKEILDCTQDSPSLIYPYPVTISSAMAQRLEALSQILHRAIHHIVTNYLSSPEIRQHMPLNDRALDLLRACEGRPLRIGMTRPDILVGARGELKVCEINARFPANGMMLSQELARAAAAVSYLNPGRVKCQQPIHSLAAAQLARFDIARPLALINGIEKGNESLFLLRQYEKAGGHTIVADPMEIEPINGDLYVGGLKVNQFILEVTRQELLAIDREVLDILIHRCEYFNDVRTQLLVHDKRLLSLLGDRSLMTEFLGTTQAEILSDHLLPSFGLHNESDYGQVLNHKDEWVIKPVSSGRGVGLHIGSQTDPETWRELLLDNSQEYMAQAYMESMRLEVAVPGVDGLSPVSMGFVGSLPCFDGRVYGPGFFRASREMVIAGAGDLMFAGLVANGCRRDGGIRLSVEKSRCSD